MNAWELVAGSYFISVRCGPQPVQFTIVTELFTGELEVGDETAGLVCTGEMVFHHVVVRAVRSVCTPSPPRVDRFTQIVFLLVSPLPS